MFKVQFSINGYLAPQPLKFAVSRSVNDVFFDHHMNNISPRIKKMLARIFNASIRK